LRHLRLRQFGRWLFSSAALISGVLSMGGCMPSTEEDHLTRVQQRGELLVVTRNSPTTYYEAADGIAGYEYELVTAFAEKLGVKARFIVEDNLKRITEMVASGEVDLAAAGLTVTPQRARQLRFGPAYQEVTAKLVFKQGKPWPRNIDQLEGELRVVAHSAYSQILTELKKTHPNLYWSETTEHTAEELLMMVLEEDIDYTIVDSTELELNRRYHPELAIAFTLGKPQSLAWAFNKDEDFTLFGEAIEFFGEQQTIGAIAQLQEKYYGHVERFDYVGAREFHSAGKEKLPAYKPLFVKAAGDDLDWRLLAAQSYQESHWNPKARSKTGVRGMMMLTLKTAKDLGISNRLDPEQSILGGAEYLRRVKARVPERIPEPDRTWFALAGYNVGWGHVEDARIITEQQGGNPDSWSDVKQRLPLLQKRRWYTKTKHGYARGAEPVAYVDNIRRYYDVLVWLDEEQQNPDLDPTGEQSQATRIAEQSDAKKTKTVEE